MTSLGEATSAGPTIQFFFFRSGPDVKQAACSVRTPPFWRGKSPMALFNGSNARGFD
jgi:hypothetical protein